MRTGPVVGIEPVCSGINNNPVFSWIAASSEKGASQTAYQIILDTEEADLVSENECFWNSGKVSSDESFNIKYSGKELRPSEKYYWRVRIWDHNNNPSEWSRTESFITGLFDESDWSGAEWIGYEEIPDSMLLVPGIHRGIPIEGNLAVKRTVIPFFRSEVFLEKKIYTMPQFLEMRYDKRVRTAMASFWLLVYVFVNLTSIL